MSCTLRTVFFYMVAERGYGVGRRVSEMFHTSEEDSDVHPEVVDVVTTFAEGDEFKSVCVQRRVVSGLTAFTCTGETFHGP